MNEPRRPLPRYACVRLFSSLLFWTHASSDSARDFSGSSCASSPVGLGLGLGLGADSGDSGGVGTRN
jgi:hypothetical protein